MLQINRRIDDLFYKLRLPLVSERTLKKYDTALNEMSKKQDVLTNVSLLALKGRSIDQLRESRVDALCKDISESLKTMRGCDYNVNCDSTSIDFENKDWTTHCVSLQIS